MCRLTTADQPNGQSGFLNADSLICRSEDADVNSFTSEFYEFIVICPDIHDLRASTLDRANTDLSGQDLYIDSDRTISSYLLHEFLHYENYDFSKSAGYDSFINQTYVGSSTQCSAVPTISQSTREVMSAGKRAVRVISGTS